MDDTILVPAEVAPVHRTEAKAHLRATSSDEDALVDRIVLTAWEHVETYCRRVMVRQQRRVYLDAFPGVIELPVGPLREVSAIKYLDAAGDEQTLASSVYRITGHQGRAEIRTDYGQVWPVTYPVRNAVWIEYNVGHAVPVSAINSNVLTAAGHGLAASAPVAAWASPVSGIASGLTFGRTYYVRSPATDTLELAATAGGAAVAPGSLGTGTTFLGRIPNGMMQALMLLMAHYNENREAVVLGTIATELPQGVRSLLMPWCLWRA